MPRFAAALAVTALAVGLVATPVGASTKADKATVRKVVLRPDDVASSWDAAPGDQEENTTGEEALATCLGRPLDANRRGRTAKYKGPELTRRTNTFYTEASAYKTTAVANKAFSVFEEPDIVPCTEQVFRELFTSALAEADPSATVDDLQVTTRDLPRVGDESIAVDAMIVATVQGQTSSFYLSTVAIRRGRFGASFTSSGDTEPFPAALEARLVRALDKKLKANT